MEYKRLMGHLAEMTTIVEESRAREEEERQAVERRRASLHHHDDDEAERHGVQASDESPGRDDDHSGGE